jgi:hypothetical protein
MIREFTLIALIFPNVLEVETSLAGLAKLGATDELRILSVVPSARRIART